MTELQYTINMDTDTTNWTKSSFVQPLDTYGTL